MLRWSLLMSGALLFLQPLSQLATMMYVLHLFGVDPWTKSFYNVSGEFFVWTVLKLAIGIGFMGIAARLFRRQRQIPAFTVAK